MSATAYRFFLVMFLLSAGARAAAAQSDAFYNTDRGRPMRVEDALAIPRFALDVYLAPELRGVTDAGNIGLRPGLALGLVPRTQIELDVPIVVPTGDGSASVAGVRLGAQHNLNVERRSIPALAVEAAMLLPAGSVGNAHPAIRGLVTKGFRWGRLHVNSEATFGDEPLSTDGADLSRWESGISIDRSFPRQATLLAVEVVARRPMAVVDAAPEWQAGLGGAYQLTPGVSIDGATGYTFTGDRRRWTISAAVTRQFAVPGLWPGAGRWGRR